MLIFLFQLTLTGHTLTSCLMTLLFQIYARVGYVPHKKPLEATGAGFLQCSSSYSANGREPNKSVLNLVPRLSTGCYPQPHRRAACRQSILKITIPTIYVDPSPSTVKIVAGQTGGLTDTHLLHKPCSTMQAASIKAYDFKSRALPPVFTNMWLHHPVIDFPHSVQRHATIQINGSSHGFKYITKCLWYFDIFFTILVQTVHLEIAINSLKVPIFGVNCKLHLLKS